MSAVLAHEQIDSVIADLELLKDIRRALADLRDAELTGERLTFSIGARDGGGEVPICFVHGGGVDLGTVALQAMERDVSTRLAGHDIEVTA